MAKAIGPTPADGPSGPSGSSVPEVIPVIAESFTVGKEVSETGRGVRVTKQVFVREEVVDEPLAHDALSVERIPLNRFLDASQVPSIRQEGEVTVVPILEEVLVTEKRLLLKEEVRITRVRREVREPQRVVLRSEQVSVEQFDESKGSAESKPRDV